MPEEKRIDPSDGASYTFSEISKFYKGTYKKGEITAYWENLKPTAAPKAKAKVKAKAKPKAKTKKAPKPQKVIAVGSKFPDVELDFGFPPEKINMLERLKEKKVIIMGLPGAFTPC
mmetsp:Transcript_148056/g.258252  ORF Transcript_148056/g.258252 Transcript_148056/m.258252 type:complete len:116 (-) Transcript_148056:707-1054(-)